MDALTGHASKALTLSVTSTACDILLSRQMPRRPANAELNELRTLKRALAA
eukprot:CAMPEP_0115364510 /NCGR_PEP_ID=MMETSP0270-20121206/103804_1 /TAXON_ID=71861 /ORGANISM="Scrippsiella trochoidea, Strain CCMP3099" /LENGTH=50 /DNA_ID=CAMNT_0002787207 /DNA_START=188 /DNA_END=340 /DNA_ORIENTATION=+